MADIRAYCHGPRADAPESVEHDTGGHSGAVDLLVGGFPCQDLSVAGKRAGLGGGRSSLFHEFVRIAQALTPTWGLVENVPGLLSSHRGRDFWTVLQGLRECWACVGWRVLDSQHFGVAQRRRRLFIIGGPTEASVSQVLALFEGGGGDSPAGGEAGTDVAYYLAARTGGPRYDQNNETFVTGPLGGRNDGIGRRTEDDPNLVVQQCHGNNVGPMGQLRAGNGGLTGGVPFITHALTGEGHDASEDGTGLGTPLVLQSNGSDVQASEHPALRGSTGHDGTLVAFDTTQMTSDKNYSSPKPGDPCHPLAAGMHAPAIAMGLSENQRAELRLTDYSRQITSGGGKPGQGYPAAMVGSAIRRLTPLECERLQGFPDGWTCLCQPLAAYAADPTARRSGAGVPIARATARWAMR